MGFLLYNLATNPEKQEKVRKECQSLGKSLTVKDLNELRYLKACILESHRLTPTLPLFARNIFEDMTLHGYHIPAGTWIMWSAMIFKDQYPDSDKFIPERWIEQKKDICPFANRQFSHGPRMCIGKRFAELELLICMHKILTNFEIEWMRNEPMSLQMISLNVPEQPLDFKFKEL